MNIRLYNRAAAALIHRRRLDDIQTGYLELTQKNIDMTVMSPTSDGFIRLKSHDEENNDVVIWAFSELVGCREDGLRELAEVVETDEEGVITYRIPNEVRVGIEHYSFGFVDATQIALEKALELLEAGGRLANRNDAEFCKSLSEASRHLRILTEQEGGD